jgi:hypothetical protein
MNYVYQNYLTPELEKALTDNPDLHKFARELHHVFDLYVYGFKKVSGERYCFQLCAKNGIHVADIDIGATYTNDNNTQIPEFNYYSRWYCKQRGSDDTDRRTLRSVKLSSLISSMKRNKVVPDIPTTHKFITSIVGGLHTNITRTISGNSYKSTSDVDVNAYHAMLKILLRGEDQSLLMRFDRLTLESVLQRFDTVDKVEAERESFLKDRFHGGSMYGVCVGDSNDYLVTKFDVAEEGKNGEMKTTIHEIKRVKSLKESYEQFIPILTMFKVARDNDSSHASIEGNNDEWYFPRADKYDVDLDMNSYYERNGIGGNATWLVFPCSAT